MKHYRKGFTMLLALLITLLAVCAQADSASAEMTQLPYFLNQFDKTPLNLKQYWGKAYLLFFFTAASPECAKQIPEIKNIYESYSGGHLQIVMIHEWSAESDLHTENIKQFYGLENMTFFEDTDLSVAKKINVPHCPMTIFMNKGGYLYDAFSYAIDFDKMAEILDEMNVPRGSPLTPAPAETVAPEETLAIGEADEIPAVTDVPTPGAPSEETPVPFVTKAPPV